MVRNSVFVEFLLFENKHILIIFDTYSKYIDLHIKANISLDKLIQKSNKFFLTFGLSETILCDNGTVILVLRFHKILVPHSHVGLWKRLIVYIIVKNNIIFV